MTVKPWRVTQTRITFQDAWLTLKTETCLREDGSVLGDFHSLVYPDWVNVVALTNAAEILLVKQYRPGRGAIASELPGGAALQDEAPATAAARELLEETGYAAEQLVNLGSCSVNAATHSNLLWSFLALGARPIAEPAPDPAEELELELRDFAEYVEAVSGAGEGTQALHLAALFKAVRVVLADTSPALEAARRRLRQTLVSR